MNTEHTVALTLAEHLAQIRLDTLSPEVKRLATLGIIDTIGVTLLGATEPVVQVLEQTLTHDIARGKALVFGGRRRVGVLDAVLINGTASHAADYDDMARAMGGHPSVALVPVIVALGEALGSSGLDAIEAYVVGFEAECRLGRVVHPHHYVTGWHPTSTLGVFGAAAAAARLLRLDVQQTAIALSIAASFASGIKANFGTMTKPLHVGNCTRNGLLAAQLARNGFTANPAALEHKQGFFAAFDGLENVHQDLMLEQWGERLEVEQEAVGLKQFPCCGSTHPAIRAMFDLMRQGLTAPDVESIEITTNRLRLPHTDNPEPKSALGAKFSIQYVTARVLVSSAVRLHDFEGEAYLEPQVRQLMARTTVNAYADIPGVHDASNEFAAEIKVVTRDGRTLAGSAPHALGRGPADPMSEQEMWEKFSDCGTRLLPEAQLRNAFEALRNIERCSRIDTITQLLELKEPE